MPNATDAVWVDVLPNMKGFAPAIARDGARAGAAAGAATGASFGKAALAGAAVIAGGAALATKALFNIGATFDDVRDTIRVGTGATGEALADLEQAAKNVSRNVPASFDDISVAIADVNTRLGLTGPELEARSEQFLELSRITGTDLATNIEKVSRVFGDWNVPVEQQADSMDHLFKVSQATGIGLDELSSKVVQYGAPMRQFGFSFEETSALMGKWAKEGVNTDTIMGGLRAGLGKLSKAGKDPAAAFAEITEQIQNAGSTGEATAIAIETFGQRAGPDLAAAVREGRFELDDLLGTLGESGETIMQAGEDTMDFSEQWQIFKNQVLVGLEPLAKRVFGAVTAGMEWINTEGVGAVRAFGEAWKANDGDITSSGLPGFMERLAFTVRGVTDFVRDNSTALKVAAGVLAVLTTAVVVYNTTARIVTGVTRAWAAVQAVLNGTLLLNPIGLIVVALVALVAGLVLAYRNSETFRNVVQAAWAGIQTAVSWAWERVIKPAFTALSGFVTGTLVPVVQRLWTGTIKPAFEGIGAAISWAWNRVVKPLFQAWWAYINNVLIPIVTWLWRNVITPAFSGISTAISVAWQVIKLIFDVWKFQVQQVLAPIIRWLWESIVKPVFNWISGHVSTIWKDKIKPVLDAFGRFVEETVAPGVSRGISAIGSAWDRLRELAAKPVNFVIDTVYNNGIRAAFNKVAETFGSDARLPKANTVSWGGSGGGSNLPSASGVVARARGGMTRPGMVLVGEEGPELVDFRTPGRVYTAEKSRALMGQHTGGPLDDALSAVRNAIGGVTGMLSDPLAFVRRQVDTLLQQFPAAGRFGEVVKRVPGKVMDLVAGKINSLFGGFLDDGDAGGFTGGTGAWRRPGRGRVSSEFGMRRHPTTGRMRLHNGIDLAAGMNSPIVAARAGRVVQAGRAGGYGNFLRLDHGGGMWTGYAHLNSFAARPGQVVAAGQLVGREGTTGNSTGPHLHFNVHRGGRFVNPRSVMKFDRGGYLPPGVTQAVNLTGKPEAIYTAEQDRALQALAARGASAPDAGALVAALAAELRRDPLQAVAYMDGRLVADVVSGHQAEHYSRGGVRV